MQVKPLKNRVLLKEKKKEEKTVNGIILPDSAANAQPIYFVEAIGEEVASVQSGEEVLIGKFAGSQVELEGVEHVLIKEEDIIAVLKHA